MLFLMLGTQRKNRTPVRFLSSVAAWGISASTGSLYRVFLIFACELMQKTQEHNGTIAAVVLYGYNQNMSAFIDIHSHENEGFKILVKYQSWRTAVLNSGRSIRPESFNYVERHKETDEIFVLLKS